MFKYLILILCFSNLVLADNTAPTQDPNLNDISSMETAATDSTKSKPIIEKLQPQIRTKELSNELALSKIRNRLVNIIQIDLEQIGQVISTANKIAAVDGSRILAKLPPELEGSNFIIIRNPMKFEVEIELDDEDEMQTRKKKLDENGEEQKNIDILGLVAAKAKLIGHTSDEFAVLSLRKVNQAIVPGDLIVPDQISFLDDDLKLKNNTIDGDFKILRGIENNSHLGINDIVIINAGSSQGIVPGSIFSNPKAGFEFKLANEKNSDQGEEDDEDYVADIDENYLQESMLARPELAEPKTYKILIYRVFEHLSAGIIIESKGVIDKLDPVI